MDYRDAMDRVRDRTAADPEAVRRVRRRLGLQLDSAAAELSHLPGPDTASVARVRARLRAGQQERRRPWLLPVGAMAAMAAAALIAATVAWPEAPPEPVDLALAGLADSVLLAPHVTATHDGQGAVSGTQDDLVIDWDAGRIELEVTPHQGVAVQVRTREGTVRVVGTAFAVERDALGTHVEVTRGEVAVDCVEGQDGPVRAGADAWCEPTTAAGLLARGRALQDDEAEHGVVLDVLDRGLARSEGAVRAELQAARLGPLLGLGRTDEALDAAEAALQDGAPRAESLHRIAARLRLAAGDCDGALPHLDALSAPTPEEAAHQSRCQAR